MQDELAFKEIVLQTRALMPDVIRDLKDLIRFPSVAFPGYPQEPVIAMADATVGLLRKYGLSNARLIDVPGGYPAVYGEIPAPPGKAHSPDVRPLRCSACPKKRWLGY